MIEPVRLPIPDLRNRFALSARLAARVGALLAKGVGVSEALLESLDAPVTELLLDRELLENAPQVPQERLATLQQRHDRDGFFTDLPLAAVVVASGAPVVVLCLDDERVAAGLPVATGVSIAAAQQAGAADPSDPPAEGTSALALARDLTAGNLSAATLRDGTDAASRLFSQEELDRLQVTLLTTTRPDEKIQAIRTLRLVPLDPRRKGALLLSAIRDPHAEVRGEAAEGLRSLGLSERLTDAIINLSRGTPAQQTAALDAIAAHASSIRPGEREVLVAVLIGALGMPATPALHTKILLSLQHLAAHIAMAEGPMVELDRELARLLETHYLSLASDIYDTYRAVGRAAHAEHASLVVLQDLLRERVRETAGDAAIRNIYLALLAQFLAVGEAELDALIPEMAVQIVQGNELDPGIARLTGVLRQLASHAVGPLLDALTPGTAVPLPGKVHKGTDEDAKEIVLSFLNGLFTTEEMPADLAVRITQKLLAIYPSSRPQVRLAILECPFWRHPSVSAEIRRDLTQEILEDLPEHRLERDQDQLCAAIVRLGPAIVPTLLDTLARQRRRLIVDRTADVLGAIALKAAEERDQSLGRKNPTLSGWRTSPPLTLPAPATDRPAGTASTGPTADDDLDTQALLHGALERLGTLIERDTYEDRGPLWTAIGRVAYATELDAEAVGAWFERMFDAARASSAGYFVLEALSLLAANPSAPPMVRVETAFHLSRLLEGRFPESLSKTRQTEEGTVYELTAATSAYTELLPRVMVGLVRLAVAPQSEEQLRRHVLQQLLRTWDDLVEYRKIWGPNNVMDVACGLYTLGKTPTISDAATEDVVAALRKRVGNLTVLEYLSDLLLARPGVRQRASVVAEMGEEIESRFASEEELELEERRILLRTLYRLVLLPMEGEEPDEALGRRSQAISRLVDALRDGMTEFTPHLQRMHDHAGLHPELSRELHRRLAPFLPAQG